MKLQVRFLVRAGIRLERAMLQGLKASFRQPRVWGGGHRPDHRGLFLSPQIISQIWPYLSLIMENKVREKLEPKIREKSVHLRTFTFTKLDFGRKVSAASGRAAGPFLCPRPCHGWRKGSHRTSPGAGPHRHCPAPGPPSRPLAPGPGTIYADLSKPHSDQSWGGKPFQISSARV